jgi:putative transposase
MPYADLLRGRYSTPGQIYCVTSVVQNREPLFLDFYSARALIQQLRDQHARGHVKSLAWVVMPDHLHWLLQLDHAWPLQKVIKSVKARSALRINNRFSRSGSLWQRGYHERALRTPESVRTAARYVVANPLRAGLVERVGDYPHWDCIWMQEGDRLTMVE